MFTGSPDGMGLLKPRINADGIGELTCSAPGLASVQRETSIIRASHTEYRTSVGLSDTGRRSLLGFAHTRPVFAGARYIAGLGPKHQRPAAACVCFHRFVSDGVQPVSRDLWRISTGRSVRNARILHRRRRTSGVCPRSVLRPA